VKGFLKSLFTSPTDTILIAEPDQVLRQLEYRALSPKYRIVQTSSIEEAVRTAARHQTGIDLLLTEVRLPNGSGWDLMDLLKLDYPDLKVIYTAGSIDAEIKAHTRRCLVFMLENPFHADRLRQAVRDVLETRPNDRIVPKYPPYSPPLSRPHR
jgi:two-component system, cell cycle sensor histidine kinase and response regulator CckA